MPRRLYPIDPQANGYDDRYELEGRTVYEGISPVGIIPAGHTVQFQAAISTSGFNTWEENLEGTLDFHGKTYPIYFNVDLGNASEADFLKFMNEYFIISK